MSIIPDELKIQTFPCPKCGQIISSEVDECRFCSTSIDSTLRDASIQKELTDKMNARIRNHKVYMGGSAGVFALGLLGIASPLLDSYLNSPSINFSCWTILFLAGGAIGFFKGFTGYRQETRTT